MAKDNWKFPSEHLEFVPIQQYITEKRQEFVRFSETHNAMYNNYNIEFLLERLWSDYATRTLYVVRVKKDVNVLSIAPAYLMTAPYVAWRRVAEQRSGPANWLMPLKPNQHRSALVYTPWISLWWSMPSDELHEKESRLRSHRFGNNPISSMMVFSKQYKIAKQSSWLKCTRAKIFYPLVHLAVNIVPAKVVRRLWFQHLDDNTTLLFEPYIEVRENSWAHVSVDQVAIVPWLLELASNISIEWKRFMV